MENGLPVLKATEGSPKRAALPRIFGWQLLGESRQAHLWMTWRWFTFFSWHTLASTESHSSHVRRRSLLKVDLAWWNMWRPRKALLGAKNIEISSQSLLKDILRSCWCCWANVMQEKQRVFWINIPFVGLWLRATGVKGVANVACREVKCVPSFIVFCGTVSPRRIFYLSLFFHFAKLVW